MKSLPHALCFFAPLLMFSHSSTAQSGYWHREDIAGNADSTRWQQLAVDAAGRTHVVFARANGNGGIGIYHAIKPGPNDPWTGSWLVGSPPDAMAREQVSLAIDANGRLHVCYVIRNSNQLFYATRAVGQIGWTFEQVSSAASIHSQAGTSLDITSNGLAIIAYTGLASNELRVASQQSGGGWADGIASATANTGFAPSIDHVGLGVGDRVLVSHFDDVADDLKLTRFTATLGNPPVWSTETVMASGQAGSASAVRRLPDGSIGVAYFQLDGDAMLRFARKSGALWTHETVDSSAGEPGDNPVVGHRLAMALDATGAPKISYAKGQFALLAIVTEEIRHARRLEAGRWGVETIRTGLVENADVRIATATNSAGTPQVAVFTDFSSGPPALEWLRPLAGAWVSTGLHSLLPNTGPGSPLGPAAITHRGDEEFVLVHTVDNFTSRSLRLLRRTGNTRQLVGGFPLFTCDQLAVARPRTVDNLLFALRRNAGTLDAWAIDLATGGSIAFSNPITGVDAGPIDIALAPDGRLHFVATRGGAVSWFRSRNPEIPSPTFVFDPVPLPGNPAGDGVAIAASPAGDIAISYRDTGDGRLKLVRASAGGLPQAPVLLDTPAPGTSGQPTTDVCFDGEAPVAAWSIIDASANSTVRVKSATALLLEEYPLGTRAGTVRCKAAGGWITTAWLAVADPASSVAAHLGYGICGRGGATLSPLTVATAVPESCFEHANTIDDGFALDLAPNGQPKAAVVFRDITPPDDSSYLFLLEPADGIDADNDGFNLLAESAFATQPSNAGDKPVITPDFPRLPSGEIRHRIGFTHTGVAAALRDGNSVRVGEFEFALVRSADLTSFTRDIAATGITTGMEPSATVSSTPPISRSSPYLGFPTFFRDENPRHFTRLEYRRIHIDP